MAVSVTSAKVSEFFEEQVQQNNYYWTMHPTQTTHLRYFLFGLSIIDIFYAYCQTEYKQTSIFCALTNTNSVWNCQSPSRACDLNTLAGNLLFGFRRHSWRPSFQSVFIQSTSNWILCFDQLKSSSPRCSTRTRFRKRQVDIELYITWRRGFVNTCTCFGCCFA